MSVRKSSQSYSYLALSSRLQMSSRHCLSMSQGSLRPWSTLYLALCFTVRSLWMQPIAVGEIDPQTLSGNMNLASRIWSGIEQFCFVRDNFFFFNIHVLSIDKKEAMIVKRKCRNPCLVERKLSRQRHVDDNSGAPHVN